MKKRKKYAVGTKVKGYVETPNQSLSQHNLDMDKSMAAGMGDPLANILGIIGQMGMGTGLGMLGNTGGPQGTNFKKGIMSQPQMGGDLLKSLFDGIQKNPTLMAAYGGQVPGVPVEIEGDEVGEMPDGRVFESKGPSHEQGGIDINLPEGTEMYSKRIKVDGVSMADRKKKRKKKEVTLEELLKKDKTDTLLKNSFDRTKKNNEKEDKFDTEIQSTIKSLLEKDKSPKQEFSLGGDILSKVKGINPGDALGYLGTAYSAFAPMQNTKQMRAGDTPNINPFADFGEDALKALEESKGTIDIQKDNALSDVNLSSASQMRKSRGTARGVNQMRAMDLVTNLQDKNVKADIEMNAAKMLQSILGQQAQAENQQDTMVMRGEQMKDAADRADRDAFFSQMSKDIANKGTGIQSFAKSLNKQTVNKDTLAMIEKMKQSGMNAATIQAILDSLGSVPYVNPKVNKK